SGVAIDDGRTVVGMLPLPDSNTNIEVGDTDENQTVSTLGMDDELFGIGEDGSLDDGKTVAGMQLPNWEADSDELRAPVVGEVELAEKPAPLAWKTRIDPEATRAYSTLDVPSPHSERDLDDAETMIPLGPEEHLDQGDWLNSKGTEVDDAMVDSGN